MQVITSKKWKTQISPWRNTSDLKKKKFEDVVERLIGKLPGSGNLKTMKTRTTVSLTFKLNSSAISLIIHYQHARAEPTICPPNENMIDFIISLDESDDEDNMVIFDENSFSYKIVSVNDIKMNSENDNNEIPSSPNPTVDYFDDLDFFKDFKHEFLAIVYNNGQTSKSDYLIEPIVNPKHIDEFNLNDKTSLYNEYDEENDSHFNDLFNINHPDDSKSIKDNDDNNIDIIQSSEGNEITHGGNRLFETSYDKIIKVFRT
ncbi:hypothetical protein Tco_0138036 [Tanacetum coccineum]